MGFSYLINNGITIVFIRTANITQNPINITLPINISRFAAFTNLTGVGHAECTTGQTSSTTIRIYWILKVDKFYFTCYNKYMKSSQNMEE